VMYVHVSAFVLVHVRVTGVPLYEYAAGLGERETEQVATACWQVTAT
jgi:hypothetical protein